MTYNVVALYRFVSTADLPRHQAALKAFADSFELCGTLLIAEEGVNGTIASSNGGIEPVLAYLEEHFGISKGEVKFSTASERPFGRYKVLIKKEIVTLRQPQANPTLQVGTYVEPENWNDLINDPDVILVDTRNDYETKIGIFKGAVDPNIKVFTEFVDYVRQNMDPQKQKKVAMFCTGGIRCEKASSFMLAEGFENVYHLKGGILKYLETIPADKSLWEGECFVFDKRVGITNGLNEGEAFRCYACRASLVPAERLSPLYEEGASCPYCHGTFDAKTLAGKRMRHTQMNPKI